MRAADAAEKATRINRELLQPYRNALLGLMAETTQKELRWHLAVMVPRLPLNYRQRQRAVRLLNSYLEDRSSIVKNFALQGLANLARAHPDLLPPVIDVLRQSARNGTPAMKARSRRLLLSFCPI